MGEIKHTPWVSEFAEEADCWIVLGAMSEPDAEGVRFQPGICSLSDGRTEAEARAIAAAPEMKEALSDFVESIECVAGCADGASDNEKHSEILMVCGSAVASSWVRAKATLAKVNGEAPQ